MAETLVTIPLSNLVPSAQNVRKTGAEAGLEELVANIAAHGVLQSLTVRTVLKANGKPAGKYEVVAGARRLAALHRLAEEKRIPKTYPVPCLVIDGQDPVSVSLAENVVRAPLHPADQFDAFARLKADGLSAEDIAARFGVEPNIVIRRLKLAGVSPKLLQAYRDGVMTLEQLMAFTVSDDHTLQEDVWSSLPAYGREPPEIRRALTKSHVRGTDRRARFIGAEAYETAGGVVVRDLFDAEDQGYFTDSPLLQKLVGEKLEAEGQKVMAEGWSWVEVMPEMDYGYLARFRRINPGEAPLSPEEQAKLDALTDRHDALVMEHGDDPPADVGDELDRISAEIDAILKNRSAWSDEEKAQAGAILSIGPGGELSVERGLVKPGAKPAEEPARSRESADEADEGGRDGRESARPAYSEALLEMLSAHRTAALREVLAGTPDLALAALLHALALPLLYGSLRETCLEVRARTSDLRASAPDAGQSKAGLALEARIKAWRERMPAASEFLTWCVGQDTGTKLDLLAVCAALTVNAVQKRLDHAAPERVAYAGGLARLAHLDMADWWEADGSRYFSHVPKHRILEAIREAVSLEAAFSLEGLKKDAMVQRAEELVAGRRWLPEPLRSAPPAPESPSDQPVS